MIGIYASAYDCMVDGICYSLNQSTKEAKVTSRGYNEEPYSGDISIPASFSYIENEYNVTTIGVDAFNKCTGLTSITIPNSVTTIEERAFSGCSGLKKVIIQDLSAWCSIDFTRTDSNPLSYAHHLYIDEDTEIVDLVIPNNVTTIRDYAFYNCYGLTSVTISNSVTSIGSSAFAYCTSLASIDIPNSVVNIGNTAFAYCTSLASIDIPNSVTSIGSRAFEFCKGLTNITIPNSVSIIHWYTFNNCQSLESIYIPSSVTSIEEAAFYNCKKTKTITSKISHPFALNVSEWSEVFYGCYNATLYVPFDKKTLYENVEGWKKFKNIVEMVPEVGDEIEEKINGINFVCTIIDLEGKTCRLVRASNNASGEVTIPESVKGYKIVGIGSEAFVDGSGITCVVIPNTVTFIESNAFNGCTNLMKIISKIVTPFAMSSDAFRNEAYNTATLVVPSDKIEDYQQTEGWKEFKIMVDKNDGDTFEAYDNRLSDMVIEVISAIEKTCRVKSCFTTSNAIDIPANIRGFNIVEIGDGASNNLSFVQNVKLPEGIVKIGKNAFAYCKKLKIVNIPSTVTSIGKGAYEGCGLEAVVFNDILSWCQIKFEDETSNPLYNAHHLYINNSNLKWYMNYTTEISGDMVTSVTIPNIITEIGNYTFCGFSDLTNLNLSSSLTSIGCSAFDGCSSLKTITIPNSVLFIAENAFRNCGNLNSISLPSGHLDIRKGAFLGCNNLLNVSLSSSLVAKDYTLGESLVDIFGAQVEEYIMPSDYERIGKYVFSNSSNLKLISLNRNKISSIGEGAFYGCSKLESLDIKNNVQKIEKNIVSGCTKLRKVSLHKVGTINNSAFSGCINLEDIEINDTINYVEKESFKGCVNLKKVIALNLSAWCVIEFEDMTSNPLNIAHHIYKKSSEEIIELIIPEGVTDLKKYVFYGSTEINSVNIPSSVKSINNNAFSGCTNLKELYLNSNEIAKLDDTNIFYNVPFTKVTFGNNVTIIGQLFWNHQTLKEITVPNSVGGISWNNFGSCPNIETANLNCAVIYGFEDKKSLKYLNLGDNVEEIGNDAFKGTSIQFIIIPKKVVKIGYNAFEKCTVLTDVTFAGCSPYIGSDAFNGCNKLSSLYIYNIGAWCKTSFSNVNSNPLSISHHIYDDNKIEIKNIVLPEGVENINKYAFYGGNALTSIKMPNTMKHIGDEAFKGCSSLASINIPNSLTDIGKDAFDGCNSMDKVIISDLAAWCGITFANSGTYYQVKVSNPLSIAHHLYNADGTEITDLVIPDGVETINDYAFYGGSNFASVTIPGSLKKIGSSSFSGCTNLSKVTISDLAAWCNTNFGDNPLSYARRLYNEDDTEIQDLTIPTGVGMISSGAFAGCSSLKSLVIPNGLEYVGYSAFADCENLATVVIPNTVKGIGDEAFANCMSLYSVTSLINIPFNLDESVFRYTGYNYDKDIIYMAATLYVPRGRTAMYRNIQGWKNFTTIMETDTKFNLTYMVDGEVYKKYEIQATEVITPEPDPYKEGYIFSGWSTIPRVMPAHDVTVTGSFYADPSSVKGDVNGDGKVGIGDIVTVTNVMAGEGTEEVIKRADVNGDGEVGIGDIISITNVMAGQ